MDIELHWALDEILRDLNARLDRIHDEAIKGLSTLARSTGQRMRVDRR